MNQRLQCMAYGTPLTRTLLDLGMHPCQIRRCPLQWQRQRIGFIRSIPGPRRLLARSG